MEDRTREGSAGGRPCAQCGASLLTRGRRRIRLEDAEIVLCEGCARKVRPAVPKRLAKRRRCDGCGRSQCERGFRRLRLLGEPARWFCPDCKGPAVSALRQAVASELRRFAAHRKPAARVPRQRPPQIEASNPELEEYGE